MSEEIKNEILKAWNRHLVEMQRQAMRNEGSSAQVEEYRKLFREGVLKHAKLTKREKEELLAHMGFSVRLN